MWSETAGCAPQSAKSPRAKNAKTPSAALQHSQQTGTNGMEALTRFGLPAIVAQAIDQGGPFLRDKPMAVVKLDHIEAHLRGGVLLRGLLD